MNYLELNDYSKERISELAKRGEQRRRVRKHSAGRVRSWQQLGSWWSAVVTAPKRYAEQPR